MFSENGEKPIYSNKYKKELGKRAMYIPTWIYSFHSDHKCLLSSYYVPDTGPEQETSKESNRHGS